MKASCYFLLCGAISATLLPGGSHLHKVAQIDCGLSQEIEGASRLKK